MTAAAAVAVAADHLRLQEEPTLHAGQHVLYFGVGVDRRVYNGVYTLYASFYWFLLIGSKITCIFYRTRFNAAHPTNTAAAAIKKMTNNI